MSDVNETDVVQDTAEPIVSTTATGWQRPGGIRRIQRGRNHSYTINGTKAYGVTTAIGDGWPKPQLISWAARCVAEQVADMSPDELGVLRSMGRGAMVGALRSAPTQKRDNAAVRGTRIHKFAEQVISGEAVEVPLALVPHVEQVARFLDEWRVRPLLVEKVIGSYRFGYAGTFDLIGALPDGRRVLFDYKTGDSGIWPDHALQLAAYAHADAYVGSEGVEIPMHEVGLTEAKAVWVRADGYDVIPLCTDSRVFQTFLHVLAVARARKDVDAWKGEAERPVLEGFIQ